MHSELSYKVSMHRLIQSKTWSPSAGRNFFLVLLGVAIIRYLLGAPLYLLDDEAYYWVWSKNLALSYYDHPPMVAWLISLSTSLFGDHPMAIRLPAAISVFLMSVLGLSLTDKVFKNTRSNLHYIVISIGSIFFLGTATGMTPDAPMALFTSLTLWFFYRAVFEESRRSWYWVGIFFGMALLSKYIAILWGVVLLVFVLVEPEVRKNLKYPEPWLAVVLALLIFSPVLIWNYQHDWVSFLFQLNHGLPKNKGSAILNYFGSQAALITPVIFFVLISVWLKRLRQWRELELSVKFLIYCSMLPFIFFIYAASKAPVSANWPAFVYFTGFILVANWFASATEKWQRYVTGAGYIYLFAFSTVIFSHLYFNIFDLGRTDRTDSYYGWPDILEQVRNVKEKYPEAIIVGNNYQFHSQMMFGLGKYTGPALNIEARANQYSYMDRSMLAGKDLIIVDKAYDLNELRPYFDEVKYVANLTGRRDGKIVRQYRAVLATNYKPQ